MTTVFENTTMAINKRIENLLSQMRETENMSFDSLAQMVAITFPELSSSKGVFDCTVSINSLKNADQHVKDFPEAYAIWLRDFSPSQIEVLTQRNVENLEKAKTAFINDLKMHGGDAIC